MADRVAVVTGASGTLGTALVRLLADRGIAVLAVSRSGAAPDAGEVASIAVDLGDDNAIETIKQALPPGDLAMAVHAIG
ncbi:MAG: NAD-dependent epimerase/dehydratase family protein, partial [Candidatus Nanopelagicales bacterium]